MQNNKDRKRAASIRAYIDKIQGLLKEADILKNKKDKLF